MTMIKSLMSQTSFRLNSGKRNSFLKMKITFSFFSLLDVDQFSALHSGNFWDFDELTNFKQFKTPIRENPNRKGAMQNRSSLKQRQKLRFPPTKLNRKDILQDILRLLT